MMRSLIPLLFAAMFATTAQAADNYPNKPIRVLVPFAPGGVVDTSARILTNKIIEDKGWQFVVDNRPGANGFIATGTTARANADGYTLLAAHTGEMSVNPVLFKNMPYDVERDFTPIIMVSDAPMLVVVNASSPFNSLKDLIAGAKAKPGQLNYASAGVGSATHVNAEKFRAQANIQLTHIPFKGTPETIVETSAGRVDFMFTPVLASIPSIRDNRMRAIAVSTAKRSSALPDIPTVAEAGLPGFVFDFWIGMLAPAKTPRAVVNKLNAEVRNILQQPDVKDRLAKLGAEAMPMSPEQFDAHIKEEFTTLGAVMKSAPK